MTGYEASVIEKATNGAVTAKTLNNWTNRNLWFLPLPPPERGKPRLYSRSHIIEAALAAHMARLGIPRETARAACKARARAKAVTGNPYRTAWEGDGWKAFEILPEFDPEETDAHWIVLPFYLNPNAEETGDNGRLIGVSVKDVRHTAELPEELADLPMAAAIVLNVSKIVRDVDAAIADASK